jgi:hypothetical protein
MRSAISEGDGRPSAIARARLARRAPSIGLPRAPATSGWRSGSACAAGGVAWEDAGSAAPSAKSAAAIPAKDRYLIIPSDTAKAAARKVHSD